VNWLLSDVHEHFPVGPTDYRSIISNRLYAYNRQMVHDSCIPLGLYGVGPSILCSVLAGFTFGFTCSNLEDDFIQPCGACRQVLSEV